MSLIDVPIGNLRISYQTDVIGNTLSLQDIIKNTYAAQGFTGFWNGLVPKAVFSGLALTIPLLVLAEKKV
eukprot:CAMPEP_0168534932 /NCGR_PEP_ID=MMETSP0405-20121227/18308_1 /TAXON_ID=498012 /ORGANISM="Trichosphaerium sp, Strain Am-I-7 wt" /LENGTH=69 /DNA_ID=CAMNT_0008561961 /DNA_START=504 /DNA_END=710 /DNA_ORIENTATION=-